jgi:hypothetical protein
MIQIAPLLRTLKKSVFGAKMHPGCQQSFRLAQCLKYKAAGAGASEENQGAESGPEVAGARVDAPAMAIAGASNVCWPKGQIP